MTDIEYKYKLDKPCTAEDKLELFRKINIEHLALVETGTAYLAVEIPEPTEEELALDREQAFKEQFIETLWGWYRKQPKGYSNAPQTVDIIDNMVNKSGAFTEQISTLMIFYTKPDFTIEEQMTEEWLVANQYKHEPCTKEEFTQFYIDFQTKWAAEQYQQ